MDLIQKEKNMSSTTPMIVVIIALMIPLIFITITELGVKSKKKTK
jgi:hypothetical protein